MRVGRSLQARLAVSVSVLLVMLWVGAAYVTAIKLRHEMDEVFDSALQETAQRLLPLAVVDILGREDGDAAQRLAAIRDHDEFFTYLVRDGDGRILLQSHAADPANFPAFAGTGFAKTASHRLYYEEAVQGSITITVAEPLAHRAEVAGEIQAGLGLPLLVVIPLALLAIILAVRASLAPLRRLREQLATRNARDMSAVPIGDLPIEIRPMVATLNVLLGRLNAAFDAERSFAANAAHEVRTPLAGAIAQAQRLQSETSDPAAARRAAEIEATLKRLTRLAERLMQLARAEGGRLRLDQATDLRNVARIVADDLGRATTPERINLTLPDLPVMSDLDPDAFGILSRNLVENALRHGDAASPVIVTLLADGTFSVANDGPLVPPETLNRLSARFERAGANAEGSGLGLAIAAAIAERIGSQLVLRSPRPGRVSGFEATIVLPT